MHLKNALQNILLREKLQTVKSLKGVLNNYILTNIHFIMHIVLLAS